MSFNLKHLGLLGVAGIIAITAACSSTSSSTTGTETITGSSANVTANTPTIPLKATGVFTDTGSITLNNDNSRCGTDGLKFSKGTLKLQHCAVGNPNGTQAFNATACTFMQVNSGNFKVVPGSTGDLKGYTGNGTYKVTFNGKFALVGGKCPSATALQNAQPTSGLITFTATSRLTS